MRLGRRRRSQSVETIRLLSYLPLLLLPRLGALARFRQGLLLLRSDALLPSSHTRTVTRLLPLAPIDEFELTAGLNLTSHIHSMTRPLSPTPIEELVQTTIPSLASYTLETNLNLTYHTRTTSWPLTSYIYAMARFLPPTPIEELELAAHPNPISYTHV